MIHLERLELAAACPIAEKSMEDICEEMKIWGCADEATSET